MSALPSSAHNAQEPDGVRALKPGQRCEARLGRPGRWVAAKFDGTSSGGSIVFVTILADGFEVGLSWKDIRRQSANAGRQAVETPEKSAND